MDVPRGGMLFDQLFDEWDWTIRQPSGSRRHTAGDLVTGLVQVYRRVER